jgi:hypothetical protein
MLYPSLIAQAVFRYGAGDAARPRLGVGFGLARVARRGFIFLVDLELDTLALRAMLPARRGVCHED